VRYISRSRIEARKCPRKYYYQYLAGERGYSESEKNIDPLGLGIMAHKGIETLFKTNNISLAVDAISLEAEPFKPTKEENLWELPTWDEAKHLSIALTMGWYRSQHEKFLDQYEVVMVEKEIEVPLAPNIVLIARADLVVRDRNDGTLGAVNWKTTNSTKDWSSQWMYDIQAWTEGLAIEKELQERIGWFKYIGLYKGVKRGGTYSSPLIYGYKVPSPKGDTYTTHYRKGLEKICTWKTPTLAGPGLGSWISWLPTDVVGEQFVISNPIFRNDEIVEEWLRQVVRWESDAEHMSQAEFEDQMDLFEQRFSKWNCAKCAFQNLCFKRSDLTQMTKAGILVPRSSPVSLRETLLEATNG
jgi:hypothetical protein